jgi:ribosomal protein L11 methyltransferase
LAEYPAIDVEFVDATDAALPDRLHAILDDYEPLAIHESDAGDHWRVFFRTARGRDGAAGAIARSFAGDALRAHPIDVADEDWARRSQQDLKAVQVGDLVIAPPWDVPRGSGGRRGALAGHPVIVIEPSTGFGTGHHATTRLCLALLQGLELRGARVTDIGTGSGVLALAAWKLGAAEVTAVDHDPDALDNARANVARNGGGAAIDIIQDDVQSLRIERADVVIANLTGAAIVRYAAELAALAAAEGYLVLSGFAPDDLPIVERAFPRTSVVSEQADGEWAAVCLRT